MEFDFILHREKSNLIPLQLRNKEKYHNDLFNLEDSTSGRLDALLSNTFIGEAVELIINSMALFEMGYFDTAFYSLRQSLEVSTTMTYLVDNDRETRRKELSKWKEQGRFPMYGKMVETLDKKGTVFSEIKAKLGKFFNDIQITKQKLNKYVHKQGFSTFYVVRNQRLDGAELIDEYEEYLKVCIGAVAVLRLTIDPFPVLINDDEIYSRTGDLLTYGYKEDFISFYIGKENIENYKETKIYKEYYDSIIKEEPKNEYVLQVVKDQFIDKKNIERILDQKHLLDYQSFVAVVLINLSEKIAKIYCIGGMQEYYSSTLSKRKKHHWSGKSFKEFEENEIKYNQTYDEAFISCAGFFNETFFIEHNDELNEKEIQELEMIQLFHNEFRKQENGSKR